MNLFKKIAFVFIFIFPLLFLSCTHLNKNAEQNLKAEPSAVQDARQAVRSASEKSHETAEERDIRGIIEQAEQYYSEGLDNYRRGMTTETKKSFNMAVEVFLTSGYNLYDYPQLEEAYSGLVERIIEFENNSFQSSISLDDYETPVDRLEDLQTLITPEEALKERELVGTGIESLGLGNMIELNDEVLAFIEYYSTRINERFAAGLKRSGGHLDMMKRIFREEGIPENLVYMAHVESSFKTFAYSRAKAKGVWQFIPGTGRRYGLRIDWWIDERCDPEKSTRAAVAYLKDLYAMFGDWNLALAGYNAGEAKIQKAIVRTGKKDFWAIAKTHYIRNETKNYVPAIHAAILIANEPQKYGFSVEYDQPIQYDKITVDSATDLRVIAKCAGTTAEEIKKLNPALYRMQTPPGYPEFTVCIPVGKKDIFAANFTNVPRKDRILYTRHLVKKGETLSNIAKKYGTSVSAIQRANNLGKKTLINVSDQLVIPGSGSYEETASIPSSERPVQAKQYQTGEKITYRVGRGDSLFSIARRFGTDVDSLSAWNGISKSKTLYPGDKLVVYSGMKGNLNIHPQESEPKERSSDDSNSKIIYTVRKGDTLYRIATLYNITIDKLCSWNNLSRYTKIYPGNKVTIYSE